jgi:hypothetical protein
MKIPEETWTAKIHSRIPAGRRKWRRPKRSWRDGVTEERWVQKTPRTGYFGGEDWEGGGPPYKPTHTYIYMSSLIV